MDADDWEGWERLTPRELGELGRWRFVAAYSRTLCQLWVRPQQRKPRGVDPFPPREHAFFSEVPGRDGRCAGCGSDDTLCRALGVEAIDLGVDETTYELACSGCGRFTTVEVYRDSS